MLLLLLLPDCLKELRRQMEYLQIADTDDGSFGTPLHAAADNIMCLDV